MSSDSHYSFSHVIFVSFELNLCCKSMYLIIIRSALCRSRACCAFACNASSVTFIVRFCLSKQREILLDVLFSHLVVPVQYPKLITKCCTYIISLSHPTLSQLSILPINIPFHLWFNVRSCCRTNINFLIINMCTT